MQFVGEAGSDRTRFDGRWCRPNVSRDQGYCAVAFVCAFSKLFDLRTCIAKLFVGFVCACRFMML